MVRGTEEAAIMAEVMPYRLSGSAASAAASEEMWGLLGWDWVGLCLPTLAVGRLASEP